MRRKMSKRSDAQLVKIYGTGQTVSVGKECIITKLAQRQAGLLL